VYTIAKKIGYKMSRYDNLHGDEDILDAEFRANIEQQEEERADDWKYSDERFEDN